MTQPAYTIENIRLVAERLQASALLSAVEAYLMALDSREEWAINVTLETLREIASMAAKAERR